MLKTRLLFGTLFTVVLVGLLYLDHRIHVGYGFLGAALLFTGLCTYETVRLLEKDFSFRRHSFVVFAALAIVVAEWTRNYFHHGGLPARLAALPAGELVFLVSALGLLFIPVATGRVDRVQTAVSGIFTLVYVAGFMLFLVKLHGIAGDGSSTGLALVAITVLTCKMTDTGAYAFGRLMGRRKLAPAISPNKTIAGFFGGLLVGTAAGLAAWKLLDVPGSARWLPLIAALGAVSIFAQVGDLVESSLKRYAGVKDTGRTLGVFGGALDMADSVLVAAPVAYLAFTLLLM
jgi:phosphatidate cytidylyltransferase